MAQSGRGGWSRLDALLYYVDIIGSLTNPFISFHPGKVKEISGNPFFLKISFKDELLKYIRLPKSPIIQFFPPIKSIHMLKISSDLRVQKLLKNVQTNQFPNEKRSVVAN